MTLCTVALDLRFQYGLFFMMHVFTARKGYYDMILSTFDVNIKQNENNQMQVLLRNKQRYPKMPTVLRLIRPGGPAR